MIVETVNLCRLRIPLRRPYKIASAVMDDFDCTIVALGSGGQIGLGEAMAGVKGYFWETPDEVWRFALKRGRELAGLKLSDAAAVVRRFQKRSPCAATPFLAALELLSGASWLPASGGPVTAPIVGILQESHDEKIRREVESYLAQGYQTIKVKVGFDPGDDIRRVRTAQESLAGRGELRADANQGYTFDQALRFVRGVDPLALQFLEQPFPEGQWQAMADLARVSPIPLGLDESVYDMASVEKARKLKCARFVKFKLMKVSSMASLVDCIERSRGLGFGVILGNGAAGEISCGLEALVAARTGTLAGEMNGFLKQRALHPETAPHGREGSDPAGGRLPAGARRSGGRGVRRGSGRLRLTRHPPGAPKKGGAIGPAFLASARFLWPISSSRTC